MKVHAWMCFGFVQVAPVQWMAVFNTWRESNNCCNVERLLFSHAIIDLCKAGIMLTDAQWRSVAPCAVCISADIQPETSTDSGIRYKDHVQMQDVS